MDIKKDSQSPTSQGTMVDGIAASEALDSSGERLSIEGLDITTLVNGAGVLNYEHKSDTPASIIGKIITAKKIFKVEDCENERQKYFWSKVNLPYLYITGELFDAVGHDQAREVAAMLRYDESKKGVTTSPPVVNFSIEGAKIAKDEKTGEVTRSIAKKCSLTVSPCNKTSIAEIYRPEQANMKKSPNRKFDTLFKSEVPAEVLEKAWIIDDRRPAAGKVSTMTAPKNAMGNHIGSTSNGHQIFSHAQPGHYTGFTSQDHRDAMNHHYNMSMESGDAKVKGHHIKMSKLHSQAMNAPARNEAQLQPKHQLSNHNVVKKAEGNAAPSTLTGQGALQREHLKGEVVKNDKKEHLSVTHLTGKGHEDIRDRHDRVIGRLYNGKLRDPNAKVIAHGPGAAGDANPEDKTKTLAKGKNARIQRERVFGTSSQPAANSPMREKHMRHIANFSQSRYGIAPQLSGGKIDVKTGQRRSDSPEIGVDKPDWRSGQLEAQNNPDAMVHELGHLEILPPAMGLPEGQTHMDRQYADVQRDYGYMKQKRSQGEVQPMAVEQHLRRRAGLPANRSEVPVKPGEGPRTAVEDGSLIGTRITKPSGKVVDLIRQARFMSPENKERIDQVDRGEMKFHPQHGWVQQDTPNARINRRARWTSQNMPDRKDAKTLMRNEVESAYESFGKSEELLKLIETKYPEMSESEQLGFAKMVAYKDIKIKESKLEKMLKTLSEEKDEE